MDELRLYEELVIINPSVTDERAKEILEIYGGMVTEAGGEILFIDIWGKKRLCYEINKLKKAYYGLIQFKLDVLSLKEIERKMKLDENIVRYLTLIIKPSMLIAEGEPIVIEEDKGRYGDNRRYGDSY